MKFRLFLALLLPFAACALQLLLWDQWIKPYVWFMFFPVAFFGAWLARWYGGVASTLISALLVWYVFIPPRNSLQLDDPSSAFSVVVFVVMGLLFAYLFERLQRAQMLARVSFEGTFEQAAVGVALVSPEGRWLRSNRKLSEIIGYTEQELLSLTFQDITHPDDLVSDLDNVRRMLAREIDSYSMEKRYRQKSGDFVWINLTVGLVRKHDNTPEYFVSVVEDISRRKATEFELAEKTERLKEASRLAALGHWKWDIEGDEHIWSKEIFSIYGRDPELPPAVYPEVQQYFTPASWVKLSAAVKKCATDGVSYECDAEVLRPTGEHLWIMARGEAVRNSLGKVSALHGTVQDITARKQSEVLVRKLSMAVEQSPESIVITDLAGTIEYINDAFLRQTGYQREELIGQNPRILRSGKTPRENYVALWEALKRGEIWKGEFSNFRKDGSEFTEFAIITPIRDPDGQITHYVAIKEDITEKKRLGAELSAYRFHLERLVNERTVDLERAREYAETATQAKSSFLANMSHEIRTPLNAVLGLARIGMRENIGRKTGETCQQILNSGQHLLGVINDILDFSKIEAGKFSVDSLPFQPAAVIANAANFVAGAAADKGLKLHVEEARLLPEWVIGDPLRLQQILANLLSNAVKFTAQGNVRLAVLNDGDAMSFVISDEGIGMTAEQVERLFQPFVQADASTTRQFGGTGLGLAISQRLAGLMAGTIKVTSTPGIGSVFTLSLPLLASAAPEISEPSAATAANGRLDGIRILAAEDVDINRLILADILEQVGADCVLVENGAQAVSRVTLNANAFDVVLMDVQMPVMDGHEASRRIRQIAPNLPVIGLTAHAFSEERAKCEAAGMVDHVTKPINPVELITAITRQLKIANSSPAASISAIPDAINSSSSAQNVEVTDIHEPIDWKILDRRFNGKQDFILKLIRTFLDSHGGSPDKLRALSTAQDFLGIAFLAHSLRSVAGNLAANGIHDLAAAVEISARINNPDALVSANRLADCITVLFAKLKEHLKTKEEGSS